jgi:hypothetical protein
MKALIVALLLAHDWYPPDCCGHRDCHPISCKDVMIDGAGYKVYGVHVEGSEVRPSLDEQCHWCQAYATKCLFLPKANS